MAFKKIFEKTCRYRNFWRNFFFGFSKTSKRFERNIFQKLGRRKKFESFFNL